MATFAEKIISYYRDLDLPDKLPPGIFVMNPFRSNKNILSIAEKFYHKYYNDQNKRHLILGINPGRFGAGVTGIPFTDTIRLREKCGITLEGLNTYETSSVFIYDMIDEYGGAQKFYSRFFVSAVSPLGFIKKVENGRKLNYNYYDSRELADSVHDFIINNLKKQLEFGISRNVCFCLGTGKNFRFLSEINMEHDFFLKIEPLEHPRYIMQYRSREKSKYTGKYIEAFNKIE
jgi:hypothetical protein